MNENFVPCLEFVLKHEGLWSDDPRDPGGATMKGVTLAVYKEYLGRDVSKDELKAIPDEHLHDLYQTRYWNKAKCDLFKPGLDLVVFDMAVNSGVGRAAKLLQRCVGAVEDGVVGPKTLDLISRISAKQMIIRFSDQRRMFYKGLKAFETFGRGWMRRVDECETKAIQMTGDQS